MEERKGGRKNGNITRWWLQLQFAFFQDKRVRALRRKYGDLSLIIYQKMMLKSLESSCRMRFEGLEDTFEEEIAVDIVEDECEKIPLIRNIVEFLIKHDLMIEEEDGEYYFPQAAKMCASETDSAERMRRKRARDREKEASQCYGEPSPDNDDSNDNASQCRGNKSNNKSNNIKELELEEDKRIDYQQIADMYNDTCVSFPRLTRLSDARKKAIRARLNTYSLDDFQKSFEMAEGSSFLKGQNGRNWVANFDWMIKDSNMAKILDGNYIDSRDAGEGLGKGQGENDISAGGYAKTKEELEEEIYTIALTYISQETFDRYPDKTHELIRLCCPLEDFTQEQIDYIRSNWGIELRPGVDRFIPPTEENYHWWDSRLSD